MIKGVAIADLLTLLEEVPDTTEPYRYIDPEQPWRELYFENCTFKEMKQLIIKDGKLIVELTPPPNFRWASSIC